MSLWINFFEWISRSPLRMLKAICIASSKAKTFPCFVDCNLRRLPSLQYSRTMKKWFLPNITDKTHLLCCILVWGHSRVESLSWPCTRSLCIETVPDAFGSVLLWNTWWQKSSHLNKWRNTSNSQNDVAKATRAQKRHSRNAVPCELFFDLVEASLFVHATFKY